MTQRNVNMGRLYDQAAKHESRAAPYLANARMTSYRIHGDKAKSPRVSQDDEAGTKGSVYYEQMLLGIIDGTTGGFNASCRSGLAETVRSAFALMDNVDIYDPRKVSKFSLANIGLTEATNVVYAFCDISHLTSQFVTLSDYTNYEQYIVLSSRIGGAMINAYGELNKCIVEGKERGNGYDVGLCSGELFSVFLDTTL